MTEYHSKLAERAKLINLTVAALIIWMIIFLILWDMTFGVPDWMPGWVETHILGHTE